MTLPTISVYLDHIERCEVRTRLEARLARRHRSHLMDIVPTGNAGRSCTGAFTRWQ